MPPGAAGRAPWTAHAGGPPDWPLAALLTDASLAGVAFTAAYAAAADRWLSAVAGEPVDGAALVAVGGYATGRLSPASDLDILLLHAGLPPAAVRALADRLLYPLWDTGVRVDHSVRTHREAANLADAELEVAVGLLDARCVWGDPDLVAGLRATVRDRWRRAGRRRLAELVDATVARHAAGGEVAFLLEPDLKNGRGGLRDVVALRAASLGSPVVPSLDTVDAASDVLTTVRVALHRRSGRRSDVLVLEQQEDAARAAGFGDADAMMVAVAVAARTIARTGDDAWRRVRSWIAGPRGRQGSADRALGPGLVLRDGEVGVVGDPVDASLAWSAAAAAAELQAPLSAATLERLAAELHPQHAPWTAAARQSLVALLATGHAAVEVFEVLDEAGLLVRLVPEWEAVRSRPQRNALHRFTVDRHLCEAAAEAASLARFVGRPDLLLIGAWLHDIGKGQPGDHTAAGVALAYRLATRFGFHPGDVDTICALVAHHLLLPDVATRRDLDDPDTIARVAGAVASTERLELLAALAEADGRATGPTAWGRWKAGLVADLVSRVRLAIEGGQPALPEHPLDRARASLPESVRPAVDEALAAGRLAVVAGGDPPKVAVVAPDRPGVLALIAGVFALSRLAIVTATCDSTGDGRVLDVFAVDPGADAPIDTSRLEADLAAALDGRLAVSTRVAERTRAYRRRAATPPAVRFEAGAASTILEVRASDDVGLLHRVAAALAAAKLDVRSAKVATLGHEVVDTFVVTERDGPVPRERWEPIGRSLTPALAAS